MAQLVEHNLAKVGVQVVRQRPAKPLPPVRIRASPPGNIRALRRPFCFTYADMAQLVEHNLAKVGVAGSSPVVRSKRNSPTTTVAGLFRTRRLGSNPRGSDRFGAWLWRCLSRMSALGVSSWASRITSLQGRYAPWLQKSLLRARGCPMPRSIRSTRARLRIRLVRVWAISGL